MYFKKSKQTKDDQNTKKDDQNTKKDDQNTKNEVTKMKRNRHYRMSPRWCVLTVCTDVIKRISLPVHKFFDFSNVRQVSANAPRRINLIRIYKENSRSFLQ